jgi:hypothetical protein
LPWASESLFFSLLTSHNPCFFFLFSLSSVTLHPHGTCKILRAAFFASDKQTAAGCKRVGCFFPLCSCVNLLKRRSVLLPLLVVLHTNDSFFLFFFSSHFWMGTYQHSPAFFQKEHLPHPSSLISRKNIHSHHFPRPSPGLTLIHIRSTHSPPDQMNKKRQNQLISYNFLLLLEILLLQEPRLIPGTRRRLLVFVQLARPQSLLVRPVLPRRFPRQQTRPAEPERQFWE